ncbi:HAD family hydrolase [Lactococcus insecticola]|uniref:Phosphoserine phosphatase n=1 Tax=Pseudolactococcus insecticola TaxID=2709158 RepID=A0A6A0B584_9LACT|nr:HAD family hydrolase [Lactococcus insecticola]GFH40176.1 putative uncharacterized hydrolase YsaA [Lactococcus insecticola]
MTVKTIIFDLDDTLLLDEAAVQIAFDRTTSFVSAKYPQIDAKLLEEAVRDRTESLLSSYDIFDFTVQIGIGPYEVLWGEFADSSLRFPDLRDTAKEFRQMVWSLAFADVGVPDMRLSKVAAMMFVTIRLELALAFDDTYEVLDQLKDAGYQLVLLTNGAPSLQHFKIDKTRKLRQYFDKILVSGDFGQGKPAPGLFDFTLTRATAEKASTVMVGDNLFTDILGANASGIISIWLNRDDKPANSTVTPDHSIQSLHELPDLLEKL